MASNNVVVVTLADGKEICFSYGVPVAGFCPGRGYLMTDAKYSVTTSKHANAYMGGKPTKDRIIPDAEFRELFADVHHAQSGI